MGLLYEGVLISEVSKKFVDEIKKSTENGELPFQDIFNDKLRIVLPISGTEIYNEILNDISQIKDYAGFDPQKKEVIRKIKLDPKYGGGEKEQKINLGKVINSLKLDPDKKKRYLNWFANYESNIPEMDDLKKYSVVVSRSPIDVLRMSDIGGISSCHSQGGSYFQCAIQEAKTGGAIAYVVNTADIQNLSDEEFQNEEIFEDATRNIQGIDVYSRLRIRRYKIDNDLQQDIGVSETRTYGKRIPGFYDTVNNFLLKKQEGFDQKEIYNLFKTQSIIRTGGTYTDSSDSELFNRMYGTEEFRGSTPHEDVDENASRELQFEEELTEFDQRYGSDFKHCNSYFDLQGDDEGGDVYYIATANILIDLGEYQLTDDFAEMDERYTIERFMSKREMETPYRFKNKPDLFARYRKFLQNFEQYDKTDFVRYYLNRINIRSEFNAEGAVEDTNKLMLGIEFKDESEISSNTDDYRDFLQNTVSEIDNDYESIKKSLLRALISSGFIKQEAGMEKYVPVDNEEEFIDNLKNFEYDEREDTFESAVFIGKFDIPRPNDIYTLNADTKFGNVLENYLNIYYKAPIKSKEPQPTFDKFFESHYNEDLFYKYGIRSIGGRYTQSAIDNKLFEFKLKLEIELINENTAHLIKFIDDNYGDIENMARLLFLKTAKIESDYRKRLEGAYRSVM